MEKQCECNFIHITMNTNMLHTYYIVGINEFSDNSQNSYQERDTKRCQAKTVIFSLEK